MPARLFQPQVISIAILKGAETWAVAFASRGGEGHAFALEGSDGAVQIVGFKIRDGAMAKVGAVLRGMVQIQPAFKALVVQRRVSIRRGEMFGEAQRVAIPGYRAR